MTSHKSTQSPQDRQTPDGQVEIITPLKVHRPRGPGDPDRPRRPTAIHILFLIIIFGIIAAGGLFYIRHLSKHPVQLISSGHQTVPPEDHAGGEPVSEPGRTAMLPVAPGTLPSSDPFGRQQKMAPNPAKDPEKIGSEKEAAEQALAAFLKLKKTLEEKGVGEWGGDEYDEMTTLSREGDALFKESLFLPAAAKYDLAERKAAFLTGQSQSVLQTLLAEGETAIEGGDSTTARKKLRVALMIDPSNGRALKNMVRAENLDGVMRLIESGRNHEKNHRISAR